jgi:hypothetical protein
MMKEIKAVWVQTAPARLPDYAGAAEQGFYFVTDGALTMCTEAGKPMAKPYKLAANDDPHVIAGRLRLKAWRQENDGSDFNRRIVYPRSGVA